MATVHINRRLKTFVTTKTNKLIGDRQPILKEAAYLAAKRNSQKRNLFIIFVTTKTYYPIIAN